MKTGKLVFRERGNIKFPNTADRQARGLMTLPGAVCECGVCESTLVCAHLLEESGRGVEGG